MKTNRAGLTLVELLVSFAVFIMLISALVTLTTKSIETWHTGETRKDLYDRAQGVLETLARDLRNVYVENEWYDNGRGLLVPPAFACDEDKLGRDRLRFVRTGNAAVLKPAAGTAPPTIIAPMHYVQPFEVAYVMDPDPEKAVLWRGIRSFTREGRDSLLVTSNYDSASDAVFAQVFRPVETGVLYVGYRFWTQYTTTWDEAVPLARVAPNSRRGGGCGPELRWDSTRKGDSRFFLHRRRPDIANPDFVYPEIVQVVVVMETVAPDRHGVRLAAACDSRTRTLALSHTRGLPDAPAMARVGNEWVEYGGMTDTTLTEVTRGARGTAAEEHAAQTAIRFGEIFTTDVRIAAYREAQEP